jgi:fumarate reductase subunit D
MSNMSRFAVPAPALTFALWISRIFSILTIVGVVGSVAQLQQYIFPTNYLSLSDIPYLNSLPQNMQSRIYYFGLDYFILYYDALRIVHGIMPLFTDILVRSMWVYGLHFLVMALAFCCDIAKLGVLIWDNSICPQIWYCITPPSSISGHPSSIPFDVQFYVCIYFIAEAVLQVLFYCFLVRHLAQEVIKDEEELTGRIDTGSKPQQQYTRVSEMDEF